MPFWLEAVGKHLGQNGDPLILGVFENGQPIGIAPLLVQDSVVRFLGDPDVCDYQDIISAPGAAADVVRAVIAFLGQEGLKSMDLGTLRPEAKVHRSLQQLADDGLVRLEHAPDEVTYEAALPDSWDLYLQQLNGKQRHEVRRKIRRLEAAGAIGYETADHDNQAFLTDAFISLFRSNRQDKAEFMSDTMESYFRHLINASAEQGILRLHLLTIDHHPAAAVLCFDFEGVRYLYNSGFDQHYLELSVGVLSKVFSIQKGIEAGCRRYDFLKGAETYKKRIGGQEVPLYHCRVSI